MDTLAKDIMTTQLLVGHPAMTLEQAIQVLFNGKITGFPIVDQRKRLIGVLSELDVIKLVEKGGKKGTVDLKQTVRFTKKVTVVKDETPLQEILKLFIDKRVRRLPVINSKKELVGIISRRDIMRVLYYRSKVR